jgi:hypothetical protein
MRRIPAARLWHGGDGDDLCGQGQGFVARAREGGRGEGRLGLGEEVVDTHAPPIFI